MCGFPDTHSTQHNTTQHNTTQHNTKHSESCVSRLLLSQKTQFINYTCFSAFRGGGRGRGGATFRPQFFSFPRNKKLRSRLVFVFSGVFLFHNTFFIFVWKNSTSNLSSSVQVSHGCDRSATNRPDPLGRLERLLHSCTRRRRRNQLLSFCGKSSSSCPKAPPRPSTSHIVLRLSTLSQLV